MCPGCPLKVYAYDTAASWRQIKLILQLVDSTKKFEGLKAMVSTTQVHLEPLGTNGDRVSVNAQTITFIVQKMFKLFGAIAI